MQPLPYRLGSRTKPIFKLITALFLCLILLLPAFALPPAIAKVDAAADVMKVIEVRYFPNGETNVLYHPDDLSNNLQTYIENASQFHGYEPDNQPASIDVQVVGVYDRFTARPNPDGTWQSTYNAILADGDLCSVINSQGIDQVWMWVDPRPGYDTGPGVEYAISSNYFQTGAQFATVATPPFCGGTRSFMFMGFDYSRQADNALHSFGHMMEGVLGNLQTVELFWYRFGGNTAAGYPLSQRCGNVHFPPNGTADYDYDNLTVVSTYCANWTPTGGMTQAIECRAWGCNQLGYLRWWMQNMPNEGNTLTYKGRKLPNWWDFVQNLDQNILAYASDEQYFMNRSFLNLYECNVSVTTSDSAATLNHTANGCGASDKLVAVSVSYRAVLNHASHRISSLQYNGVNMTKACDAHSNEYTTEIWYHKGSSLPGGTIAATWSMGAAQDIVLGSKIFSDVYLPNPIATTACNSDNGQWSSNPTVGKNPTITVNASNTVAFGAASTYRGSGNVLSADNEISRWYKTTANLASNSMTKDGAGTLDWTSTINWPWSTGAIAVRKANYQSVTVTNLAPQNYGTSLPLNNTLSWYASTPAENNPLTFDVYFGTDSGNLSIVSANQTGLLYAANGLQKGTTYYWKIGAHDVFGGYNLGPTWQFTTYNDVAVNNNLAKNKVVTASGVTGTPGYITDGYKFTVGTDQYTQPSAILNTDNTSYLRVDLGAAYTINNIALQVSNDDSYKVEVSPNGTTWTTFVTFAADTNSSGFTNKGFSKTVANVRYVRIKSITGLRARSVAEIEVN